MGRDQFEGVRAASKSTIEIDFYYRGERCRERIKLQPTPANLRRAARHRSAILDAIERHTFDYAVTFPDSRKADKYASLPGQTMTLKKYLDQWLKNAKSHVSSSTWDGYRKIVNNQLIPAFGDLKLTDLKRRHIKDWGASLTVSNKRMANILSPLRIALNEAVEDELIEINPLYGWQYKKKEAPKTMDEIDPFSPDEIQAILSKLTGQAANLIQFAFWTGLRPSEYIALNWDDIDFKRGVVIINKAITQAARTPEATKTASGTREVKLLPPALASITSQKAFTWLNGEEIFQNPRTEERWTGDQPIRKTLWAHALKRAGVRYRRPYQTRHTYASMMLSAGESPLWVAKQMGHGDWTMIARVYGKWIPEADLEAGNKAVEVFSKKGY
jgi:integrase